MIKFLKLSDFTFILCAKDKIKEHKVISVCPPKLLGTQSFRPQWSVASPSDHLTLHVQTQRVALALGLAADTPAGTVCSELPGNQRSLEQTQKLALGRSDFPPQVCVLAVVPTSLLTIEEAAEERRRRPSPCRN